MTRKSFFKTILVRSIPAKIVHLALVVSIGFLVYPMASYGEVSQCVRFLIRHLEPWSEVTKMEFSIHEPLKLSPISDSASSGVKFVIVLESNKNHARVYFLDSADQFHSIFAKQLPDFSRLSEKEIDLRAELVDGIIYGRLINWEPTSEFIFELLGSDMLSSKFILSFYEALRDLRSMQAEKVSLSVPANDTSSNRLHDLGIPITPIEAPDGHQIFSPGERVGILVRIRNKMEFDTFLAKYRPDTPVILYIDGYLPEDLPPVEGVALTMPISDMSHLVTLAKSMKIPVVYLDPNEQKIRPDHFEKPARLVALKGEEKDTIQLRVNLEDGIIEKGPRSFLLDPSSPPSPNLRASKFRSLSELSMEHKNSYGMKGIGLAEAAKVSPRNVNTVGLSTPFSFYRSFLRSAHLRGTGISLEQFIFSELRTLGPNATLMEISRALKRIQSAFLEAEVSPTFFDPLKTMLSEEFPKRNYFVRSDSFYIEDGVVHNGAGLHLSKEANPENIELILREVFSSLYTMRSFLYRRSVNFPEEFALMGTLIEPIHLFVSASGVAILDRTTGEIRISALEVNGQGDGPTVVGAALGVIPEIVVVPSGEPLHLIETPGKYQLLEDSVYFNIQSVARNIGSQ